MNPSNHKISNITNMVHNITLSLLCQTCYIPSLQETTAVKSQGCRHGPAATASLSEMLPRWIRQSCCPPISLLEPPLTTAPPSPWWLLNLTPASQDCLREG